MARKKTVEPFDVTVLDEEQLTAHIKWLKACQGDDPKATPEALDEAQQEMNRRKDGYR